MYIIPASAFDCSCRAADCCDLFSSDIPNSRATPFQFFENLNCVLRNNRITLLVDNSLSASWK